MDVKLRQASASTPSHPPSNLSTLLQARQAVDLQFSTLLQAMQAIAAVDLQRNAAYHIPSKWAINSGL